MTVIIACDHHTTGSFGASAVPRKEEFPLKSDREPGAKLSRAALPRAES